MWALWPGGLLPLLVSLLFLTNSVRAVFVTFENCLPESITDSNPLQLQFTPYFVDATLLPDQSARILNITIYGNVSGQQFQGDYPAPDDAQWSNPNETFGKIARVGRDGTKLTTLTADYSVLTYPAYNNKGEEWCSSLVRGECPLGPSFGANASDPDDLPAFSLNHTFASSYAFSTISTTVRVISGEASGADVACVRVQITPDLGPSIAGLLTWLPAVILILKGLATLSAAIWSPWGSSDIFRWSSNYGRDEDLLRLVTPGFGDCLQYIQFIVLTGCLTLQYPGFFRPAVSQAGWSTLLFNQSFVSDDHGTDGLVDGLYHINGTYGLSRMGQLIGMATVEDVWACMAIWLLVIAAIVVVLCQLGFLGRWLYHSLTHTTEEDLRRKNLPFTLGNMIRLIFNFFILPIVALSLFQLVVAPLSPISVVACAAVLLVVMVISAGWILRIIFTTKPRTLLFDDMPTVLLYGPLYNTYSDVAAPFALVPVFITFMRGVAIGALQPSGIAQIVVFAICEVILILTLNGFRPFQGQTSMNLYHTFFASVRLTIVLLMIAFAPSLGVTEATKGWIGYVILLLHACVLMFGFFLNSAQTLIEVVARSMGAGGDSRNGAIRGSILNWRMLKKRQDRGPVRSSRGSIASTAMLRGEPDAGYGARSRSVSASSQQLLSRMSGFENFSHGGSHAYHSPDPNMDHLNTFASASESMPAQRRPSIQAAKGEAEAFYRPPRPRKATIESLAAGTKTRSTADFPYQDSPGGPGHARDTSYDSAAFGSPAPAYLRERTGSTDDTPRTDYAVREVDQYYRGPALNEQATRKLKTGPADPTGPASTAQSWLNKVLFGVKSGKSKDQSKGFEVVRAARRPPGAKQEVPGEDGVEMQTSPAMHDGTYQDLPDTPGEQPAIAGAERSPQTGKDRSLSLTDDATHHPPTKPSFDFANDVNTRTSRATTVRPDSNVVLGMPVLEPISYEHAGALGVTATPPRRLSEETQVSRITGGEADSYYADADPRPRYADLPIPSLAPIDAEAFNISLPSRFNSNASSFQNNRQVIDNTPRYPPSNIAPRIDMSIQESPHPDSGSDWLVDVDQLNWPMTTRSNPPENAHNFSSGLPAPIVPRRNSRRTVSQEIAAQTYHPPNLFEGFDSEIVGDDDDDGDTEHAGTTPGRPRQPSNASHQHGAHRRAQDSISRNSIGAAAALREGVAAVEYGTPPVNEGFLAAAHAESGARRWD